MNEATRFLMVDAAPTPVAPFSHAVEAGGWLFVTGQMPTHPEDDSAPLPEGVVAQTHKVMSNLALVLQGVGYAWSDIVSVRAFLTEFERDYPVFNETYRQYFPADRLPARTCVGVTGLARLALVEVDLIARRAP
jgi:2-iminobutanoate/2-iminopropanoate deaminase